jgi:hypothetical protein
VETVPTVSGGGAGNCAGECERRPRFLSEPGIRR